MCANLFWARQKNDRSRLCVETWTHLSIRRRGGARPRLGLRLSKHSDHARGHGSPPVPTVGAIRAYLEVNVSKSAMDMWIEPPDAKRFLDKHVGDMTRLVGYPSARAVERICMRGRLGEFEIVEDREALDATIRSSLLSTRVPTLVDDGIASYVVLGWDDRGPGHVILGDPHVAKDNTRRLSAEDFFSKSWMLLLPTQAPIQVSRVEDHGEGK